MNAAAIATFLLIAMFRTNGEGGTETIPYETAEACEAAGPRLEAQFEALSLQDSEQNPVDGHPKVVWTCFDARN